MASIRERAHKDGLLTWAVLWREQDTGKQTSPTFQDHREAVMLKDLLDANGNSFHLAARSAADLRSQAPTVRDVVAAHVEGLTAVEPDTRAKAEQLARQPRPYPGLVLGAAPSIFDYELVDFHLVGYDSRPAIKAPVAV